MLHSWASICLGMVTVWSLTLSSPTGVSARLGKGSRCRPSRLGNKSSTSIQIHASTSVQARSRHQPSHFLFWSPLRCSIPSMPSPRMEACWQCPLGLIHGSSSPCLFHSACISWFCMCHSSLKFSALSLSPWMNGYWSWPWRCLWS